MKQAIFSFALLFGLLLSGCSNDNNERPLDFSESDIQMKFILVSMERSGIAQMYMPYTGRNIRWVDEATGEIQFQDPPESSSMITAALKETEYIDFYLKDEFLFSARIRTTVHSDIYNDVVLYVDIEQDKYFIKDGYPPLDESQKGSAMQEERDENWGKIKSGYQKLIDQLRKENKIK